MRSALLEAGADALHFHHESAIPQPLFELSILSCRPDGQHSALLQCYACIGKAMVVIEPGVMLRTERARAVVYIEQDRIKAIGVRPKNVPNVADHHMNAFVFERMIRQRSQRASIPFNDSGYEFGDGNVRIAREKVQCGPEGVTHAQTADQHGRPLQQSSAAGSERGESFFRPVRPARHEALAVGKNDVLVAAAREFQVIAIRSFSLSEQFQGIHNQRQRGRNILSASACSSSRVISPRA